MRSVLHLVVVSAMMLGCGDDGPESSGDAAGSDGEATSSTSSESGTSSSTAMEESTGSSSCTEVHEGDLLLDSLDDVEAASEVGEVTGSVWIEGGVGSLESLACLRKVDGSLTIYDTPLRDLIGLHNLTDIGEHLAVLENAELESLAGLESLRHAAFILVSGNGLTHLGLHALQGTGSITIGDCFSDDGVDSMLEDLDGLESLLAIGSVSIHHSPQLTSLSGLQDFAQRGGSLTRLQLWFNERLEAETIDALNNAFGGLVLDVCGNGGDDPRECFCPPRAVADAASRGNVEVSD